MTRTGKFGVAFKNDSAPSLAFAYISLNTLNWSNDLPSSSASEDDVGTEVNACDDANDAFATAVLAVSVRLGILPLALTVPGIFEGDTVAVVVVLPLVLVLADPVVELEFDVPNVIADPEGPKAKADALRLLVRLSLSEVLCEAEPRPFTSTLPVPPFSTAAFAPIVTFATTLRSPWSRSTESEGRGVIMFMSATAAILPLEPSRPR